MKLEVKMDILKTLLEDGGDVPGDDKLMAYLLLAQHEILQWKYSLVGGVPEDVTTVAPADDGAHIYAVIAGYTQAGAEGEQTHIENGVHRHFRYDSMVGYIREHVLPYVRVGAVI